MKVDCDLYQLKFLKKYHKSYQCDLNPPFVRFSVNNFRSVHHRAITLWFVGSTGLLTEVCSAYKTAVAVISGSLEVYNKKMQGLQVKI